MKTSNNAWNTLGLNPGATLQEITTAYRRLALTAHPDKGGCSKTFAKINEAYRELKDKKHIPILHSVDTVMVDVKLTIHQQVEGVSGIITALIPGSVDAVELYAEIPAGARSGDKFKIVSTGKNYILNIKEKSDSRFTREGFGVILNHRLDIITAMRGGDITVMDPCGEEHIISIKPGTTQTIIPIKHAGLYDRKKKKRGNMYVHIVTEIPTLTTDNIEEFIQQLRA